MTKFANLGEEVFNDCWMNYLTQEMANMVNSPNHTIVIWKALRKSEIYPKMQLSLFSETERQSVTRFPSTRYQGSKAKFVDWIWQDISDLSFQTTLDAIGGTGSVAYKLKGSRYSKHA